MARIIQETPLYPYTDLLAYAEEQKMDTWNGFINRLQKTGWYERHFDERNGTAYYEYADLKENGIGVGDDVILAAVLGFMEQEGHAEIEFNQE